MAARVSNTIRAFLERMPIKLRGKLEDKNCDRPTLREDRQLRGLCLNVSLLTRILSGFTCSSSHFLDNLNVSLQVYV